MTWSHSRCIWCVPYKKLNIKVVTIQSDLKQRFWMKRFIDKSCIFTVKQLYFSNRLVLSILEMYMICWPSRRKELHITPTAEQPSDQYIKSSVTRCRHNHKVIKVVVKQTVQTNHSTESARETAAEDTLLFFPVCKCVLIFSPPQAFMSSTSKCYLNIHFKRSRAGETWLWSHCRSLNWETETRLLQMLVD